MPSFHYRAVSLAGDLIEGRIQAGSRAAAIDWLHGLGHIPLRAEEDDVGSLARRSLPALLARRGVSTKRIAVLTRELAVLLNAGLPLERALTVLVGLTRNERSRALLGRVLDAVRGGMSLADALAQQGRSFPPAYTSLVRAGEAGGALESVLSRLADHLEKAQALADSLRSALIYPGVLLSMTLLSIVALVTLVLPELESLFEDAGDGLPLLTRMVLGTGAALTGYWWLMLALALASAWLLRRALAVPVFRLRWDRLILATPLLGDLVCRLQVARFSRTLGTLIANGVSLPSAMTIVRNGLGNRALARALDAVAAQLREGRGLAEPMAETAVFPELAVQLVRVGEETGELPAMLTKTAEIYDREVQLALDRLVALLVPALTIGLGLIIAVVIGSVLLAFLSVNDLAL